MRSAIWANGARELAEKAQELEQTDDGALVLAEAMARLDERCYACEIYEQLSGKSGLNAEQFLWLAHACVEEDRMDEAAEAYAAAGDVARFNQGNFAGAESAWLLALSQPEEQKPVYEKLALAAKQMGDAKKLADYRLELMRLGELEHGEEWLLEAEAALSASACDTLSLLPAVRERREEECKRRKAEEDERKRREEAARIAREEAARKRREEETLLLLLM